MGKEASLLRRDAERSYVFRDSGAQAHGRSRNEPMSSSFDTGAAPVQAGEWARKARGMLAGFPAEAAEQAAAAIAACYERGPRRHLHKRRLGERRPGRPRRQG